MTVDIRDRFGSSVILENCIVGSNLNLVSIRGFARLDVLAAIVPLMCLTKFITNMALNEI